MRIPLLVLSIGVLVVRLGSATPTSAQAPETAIDPAPAGEAADGRLVTLEGYVLQPDGTPAAGAVVTSSAGGKGVAGPDGSYRFEARLAREAERVQVSASAGDALGERHVQASGPRAQRGVVAVEPLLLAPAAPCHPRWLPTFGVNPGVGGGRRALALASFDEGEGPALFVAGDFTLPGGVADGLARWNGRRWSSVGNGLGGALPHVYALAVFDDGRGPALYAGGRFTTAGGLAVNGIARWDGASWSALGAGVAGAPNPSVTALAVHDDGRGPALYAGGNFTLAGGVPASGIARWDGTAWSALGSGVNTPCCEFAPVAALAVHDDGTGVALYAGGDFTTAGGIPASRIARWDGASWSTVGTGVNGPVLALTVFDDGTGPSLHAGGAFTTAGGSPARYIAKWDGSSWSPVGGGVVGEPDEIPGVQSLAVLDDGGGPALYVGGTFSTAGSVPARAIARWDGASWSPLGDGLDDSAFYGPLVNALAAFDDGRGPALFVGGRIESAGGEPVTGIARWDGAGWSTLGRGLRFSASPGAVFDEGAGPALHVSGPFALANGVAGIGKWDGASWAPLPGDLQPREIADSIVFDDGSGAALVLGGRFRIGAADSKVVKRSGASWIGLGSETDWIDRTVRTLAVFDDGSGPALHAGGAFTSLGGVPANQIARWNGAGWSALGAGANHEVHALAVFDDGSGPALYAGGKFTSIGGVPANRIAKWDGAGWSALGAGVAGGLVTSVEALGVFDTGSGAALYVGGDFTTAGGVAASHVARWDGSRWSTLVSGVNGVVRALGAFDPGTGPALYVGGSFTSAGGLAVNGIASWDGTSWRALGSGVSSVTRIAVFDDGCGPDLYVGGNFGRGFDSEDSYLARWGCPELATSGPRLRIR